MNALRDQIAWRLMNLAYRIATPWYGSMLVGAVYYGLDKAARDVSGRPSPIVVPDEYRRMVIQSMLREDETVIIATHGEDD